MNQSRKLLIIGIALIFAAAAALLASSFVSKPKPVVMPQANLDTADVLVAKREIRLGDRITAADVRWQAWPKDAVTAGYITKLKKPTAIADYDKAIARIPLLSGEPVSEHKFVKCSDEPGRKMQCEGGAMAAILPAGMRAIATKISQDGSTSAGNFVLPNDMVDVILTKRLRSSGGQAEEFISETLLHNVRVLAIGQTLEIKEGKKAVDGVTATLELSPAQAEQLVLAKSTGELALSLRSLADLKSDGPTGNKREDKPRDSGIRMLKYGVGSRAYGVN